MKRKWNFSIVLSQRPNHASNASILAYFREFCALSSPKSPNSHPCLLNLSGLASSAPFTGHFRTTPTGGPLQHPLQDAFGSAPWRTKIPISPSSRFPIKLVSIFSSSQFQIEGSDNNQEDIQPNTWFAIFICQKSWFWPNFKVKFWSSLKEFLKSAFRFKIYVQSYPLFDTLEKDLT